MDVIPYFYWRPNRPELQQNFGDEMTKWILRRVTNKKLKSVSCNYQGKLLSIGSVMHYAKNDDYIWGTGVNGKIKTNTNTYISNKINRLNIHAVRGEKTKQILIKHGLKCPDVFGDPGLLFSHLYPEFKAKPIKNNIKIFSHYHDKKFFESEEFNQVNKISIIHADWSFEKILNEILECEFLISTALHGLIIADSFNIPNRYMRVTESEHLLKFDDYYSGTNRHTYKYARTVNESLDMGCVERCEFNLKELIDSFPFK